MAIRLEPFFARLPFGTKPVQAEARPQRPAESQASTPALIGNDSAVSRALRAYSEDLLDLSDQAASQQTLTAPTAARQLPPPNSATPNLPTPRPGAAAPLSLPPPQEGRDVREMSPRELAEMSHDLYMEGVFSWEEYQMVGFPSELNPRFDQTIGAITGEKAKPDEPRDMIAEWQDKLDFVKRHADAASEGVQRTERIVNVLKWQDQPKVRLTI